MKKEQAKTSNRYEKLFKNDLELFDVAKKVHIDALKYSKNEVQAEITSYVIAPILYRFVLWVLQDAVKRNKKRLYFLARDGYAMYLVADMLRKKLDFPVECRYLYCSRYALRNASYHLMKEESLEYICLGGMHVTFERIMQRAGLLGDDIDYMARILGYEERKNEKMSFREIKAMKPILSKNEEFMNRMYAYAQKAYPLAKSYFEQEGLLEDIPYAIVDSGWTGSMQKSLQELLQSYGKKEELEGYYFGMYEYPMGMQPEKYHCYYFEPNKNIRRKVYFNNNVFECVFSSPEGMVKGYQKKDQVFLPVFEKKENPNKERILYSTELIQNFAKKMIEMYPDDSHKEHVEFLKVAEKLFMGFMGKPSEEEAREYGSYVFCDDVIGEKKQTVAASLSAEEIRESFLLSKCMQMLKKSAKPIKESAWPEGSVVLNQEMGRKRLFHCAISKYALYVRKRMK